MDSDDGILQIAEYLREERQVVGIHILAHGKAGSLQLGNARLDGNSLQSHADELRSWGQAFTEDGDILLYGCNVAEGESGIGFVEQLAALTGADIAASTDLTGSAALGGDWDLEHAAGVLEVSALFQNGGVHGFYGVLQATININADDKYMTEFTFRNGNVEMDPAGSVDGQQASVYRLRGDSTININGTDHQDTFLFKEVSPLTGEALAMAIIDGKGGNDIVDLGGFDNEDVTFEIGREGVSIKVLQTDSQPCHLSHDPQPGCRGHASRRTEGKHLQVLR